MSNHPRALKPIQCNACKKTINIGEIFVNHHVSYYPEIIVQVHRSCHSHIHVGHVLYQNLKPDPRQVKRWYENRGSFVYHTTASEYVIQLFFDTIENGWWNKERRNKIRLQQAEDYWNDCDRILKIRQKLNITETWNSSSL